MMKKIIFSFLIFSFCVTCAFAVEKIKVTPAVYQGIQKYKQGDYISCLENMKKGAESMSQDPSIPYYYMGNAYAQLGMRDDAVEYYNRVVELGKNIGLVSLSKKALGCIQGDEGCQDDDMTKFIKSKQFMHPEALQDARQKELDQMQAEINASSGDNPVDLSKYKYLNDASQNLPTDKEIADAVRTLARIGYNPYSQVYNPQYSQMMSFLGTNDNFGGGDFSMMLPYLMAQGASRQNNQTGNRDADRQLMQAMLLNQMSMGF